MKDHVLRFALPIAAACMAVSAIALGVAPLAAQNTSDAQSFIKAVKEADGNKATALLAAPGSTVTGARDGGGDTALHIVVKRRDAPWTRFMVQQGVDPEAVDRAGDTALGLTARIGFPEGARALIAGGAKVDGTNRRGETPLIIAVQGRNLDMVRLLVRQGANADKTDGAAGYSARDYALQDGRSSTILKALDARKPAAAAKPIAPAPIPSAKPQ